MATDFKSQCNILGQLFYQYKEDKGFADFIEYNDIGLPIAYFVSEGLTTPNEDGMRYVQETWEMFVESLDVEDTGFESLEEILAVAAGEIES
jgi:hypothetical protein